MISLLLLFFSTLYLLSTLFIPMRFVKYFLASCIGPICQSDKKLLDFKATRIRFQFLKFVMESLDWIFSEAFSTRLL